MGLSDYERAVTENIGTTFSELTDRELNPGNYQLARQVTATLLDEVVGHHNRGTWITVPIDPVQGAPREPTPVLSDLDFDRLRTSDFDGSSVGHRLRDLLLIPIVKPQVGDPSGWWLSAPRRWRPDPGTWEQLRRDYEGLRAYVKDGRADNLSSSRTAPGRLLMAKTNGRDRMDVVVYHDDDGTVRWARKRGYYLRADVVAELLAEVPSDFATARYAIGPPPEFVDAVAELTELDARAETFWRIEQGYLRACLLDGEDEGVCDLCCRSFPAELLVAAHIKPRHECTDQERRDIPSVVMLACSFGCDDLYERGLLGVDDEGGILASRYDGGSTTVRRYLAGMRGRRVRHAWPRGRGYFAWHREHVFRA